MPVGPARTSSVQVPNDEGESHEILRKFAVAHLGTGARNRSSNSRMVPGSQGIVRKAIGNAVRYKRLPTDGLVCADSQLRGPIALIVNSSDSMVRSELRQAPSR